MTHELKIGSIKRAAAVFNRSIHLISFHADVVQSEMTGLMSNGAGSSDLDVGFHIGH